MRICATSNSEQRVQVLIPVVQGLSQKQRQLMQQYFELVDWKGLKLPSAERRQRDSLKSFERSVEVWKDWIRLKKELATLGEELSPAELLPAKRKKQSPEPTKRDTSKEELKWRKLNSSMGRLRGQARVRPIDKLHEACTNADDRMMLVQHRSGDRVMS